LTYKSNNVKLILTSKREEVIKLNKYNIRRSELDKFFKLSNGQWLKVIFSYKTQHNIWFETIVVADTKRKCNDCIRKTEFSPKVKYGRSTGNKLGLEAFKIALKELLAFEQTIHNTQINIVGASDRLNSIYKYLKRYGYEEYQYEKNGKLVSLMFKKIN
jgi:hypothetical protein